jgi:hypothetical protein
MIRTVWLAALCLVALGAVSVGRVAKLPPAPTVERANVQGGGVDADPGQQPLIKADRLQINFVRQEPSNQSASPPVDPIVREIEAVVPPAETEIIDRHWHDRNATRPGTARRTTRKEKPAGDPRDSLAADRSGTTGQNRHCDRTAVFGGLLRSLNLAPQCGS